MNESDTVRTDTPKPQFRPRIALPVHLPFRMRTVVANLTSAVLALFISMIVWIVAVNEQNPPREDFYPNDLPIEIVNKPASLVLFQPFERTARVRIRASQASWARLQPGTIVSPSASASVFIDMSGTTAGLHEYQVQIKFADPDIEVLSIDPQTVSLRVEEQRQKIFPVQVSIGDSPPVGFLVGTPDVGPATVEIEGAQSLVDQVAEVVAAVQLRGAKTPIARDVPLIARDAQGNTVTGVKITPDTASVRIPIDQRLGFKDVSVKVVTRGTVTSGYWVSNISVDPSTLTLVGSPALLDQIGGFVPTEAIDIKDSKSGLLRNVGLVLPQGVSAVNTQTVLVTIEVSAITGGQTVQRQVTIKGLDKTLKATLSPDTVDMILGGPLPVLQTLKPDDVQVEVDLTNKGPGKYKVSPTVVKPDSLQVESIVPDTIEISISK